MFSYHNHTTYSDGHSNIEEIIIGACSRNLREIGVSDHYVDHPNGITPNWSMKSDQIEEYFNRIEKLKQLYSEKITVRKGIELDFFEETIDNAYNKIMKYQPDYIIGSVHYVGDFLIDGESEDWEILTKDEVNNIIELYWKKIIAMSKSKKINIVAHIDLYKKFGYFTDTCFMDYINEALTTIKNNNQAIELNTSGLFKPVNEYYPSDNIIRLISDMKIPIIITADAHYPAHIKRNFNEIYKILKEIGITQTCRFENQNAIIEYIN